MSSRTNIAQDLGIVQSLHPAARTNATHNGTGVDLAGYEGALVKFDVGAVTDGTHAPKIQESDDNSTYTDVAAADLSGALANLASNTPQKQGYIGRKRYIRAVITTTGATTGAIAGATVVRGAPHQTPAA
ncbi:MAG: hypothetical protein AB1416_10925 [Actinomycetota bacterium]